MRDRPGHLGRDDETLTRIGTFVEPHVEQGKGLVHLDAPLAVGSGISHASEEFAEPCDIDHGTAELARVLRSPAG